MTDTTFNPRTLLTEARLGVLGTIRSNGLPQLSPVTPYYDRDADVIYVSMTEGRAKTANLRRDPRAALEVTSPDGWAWATAEGAVTLTGPGTDPHSPEVEALVGYYRSAAGEHPDWDEYRSVMVSDRRVLMAMTVDRVSWRRSSPDIDAWASRRAAPTWSTCSTCSVSCRTSRFTTHAARDGFLSALTSLARSVPFSSFAFASRAGVKSASARA